MSKTLSPILVKEDEVLDQTLRPHSLLEYIGQKRTKESLSLFIKAAQDRADPLEHVLIYGPPGLGKTTLAYVVAHELSVPIRTTSGPAIERAGDLASILTALADREVLFIDEIHRLPRIIEEILYPAMEEHRLDLVIGKGPSAKTLRLDLPKFTLVGATTKIGGLSSPLRDRFGHIFRLDFYNEEEMSQIIRRSAKILSVAIEEKAVLGLAKRSRATPRVANRLLKRLRDFAQVKNSGLISLDLAEQALEMLEIDTIGLDKTDRLVLKTLIEKFNGGPVGIDTLAVATSEERSTIEEVLEPYLIQIGFINRTPKGRVATDKAFKHLNHPYSKLL